MIRCRSCQQEELVGALFCSNCGAGLSYQEVSPPHTGEYASRPLMPAEPSSKAAPATQPDWTDIRAPVETPPETYSVAPPGPAPARNAATVGPTYSETGQSAVPELRYTSGTLGTAASIKIVDSGHVLPLEGNNEFTIGRISGNQPILPDIDLTPYQAYDGGVSRLHATIKFVENQVTITDLGSANGTQVNGVKIKAHQPVPLSDGDRLLLGKFKIQIILRK